MILCSRAPCCCSQTMATVLLLATLGDASAAAGAEASGMVVHADAPIAHISPYMVGAVSDRGGRHRLGAVSAFVPLSPFSLALTHTHTRTAPPLLTAGCRESRT